jgi:hypothetical protein
LYDEIKVNSFPLYTYEISKAPFVLMGIYPHSFLSVTIEEYVCFLKSVNQLSDDSMIEMYLIEIEYFKDSGREDFEKTIDLLDLSYDEFSELANDYIRIAHEISQSDLILNLRVKDHIPTDKLLEFGELNKKPPPTEINKSPETHKLLEYKKPKAKPILSEPKALTETERDSLLKLVLGMAIDGYRYDPNNTRNTATGGKKGSIQAALSRCGLEMDQKTISKYLKDANEKNPANTRKY